MMKIKKINNKKSNSVIDTRKPLGLFYVKKGKTFVGIDNSIGDAFVEEFKKRSTCIRWLTGENIKNY